MLQKKEFWERPFLGKGSILVSLIITMLIFSVLAVIMLSLTGTSLFSQLNTSSTTKATYIAKSGYNYLASRYKNAASGEAKNLALENLHNINFQLLNNNGSFLLNVKPYYLRSQQRLTITATGGVPLLVKFPGAESYSIPASGTMAVFTADGYRRFNYTAIAGSANNYTLTLGTTRPDGQPIEVYNGTSIVPVLAPASNQTLSNGGNLIVATGTGGIFPASFGFFEIPLVSALSSYVFYYESRTGDTFYRIRNAQDPTGGFPSQAITTVNGMIYAHTAAQINSTGTFNPGGGPAFNSTFSRMAILGFNPGGNSYKPIITGFADWNIVDTRFSINPANTILTLGSTSISTTGAAWYGGNAAAANCSNGKCNFGLGIRAYFQFTDTYSGPRRGDGFTFTIMNGALNDITKRGGDTDPKRGGGMLAYAGSGNTADGLGLRPPKLAVEFDKFSETGGTYENCNIGRNDTANNHLALVFWGDNISGVCSNGNPAVSYDDNVHGAGAAGSTTIPQNSYNGGTGGYYERAGDWLNEGTQHAFRIEVTRDPTANVNGNYYYNIKAWIDCTSCNDISVPYDAFHTA